MAKGVRKTKSRFGGRLEPFSHVELVLYEGRNLDTITQVDTVEPFRSLRSSLDAVTAASTMVEAVDAFAQENEPSVAIHRLLLDGLRTLDGSPWRPDIVTAFLLQLAAVVGVAPALSSCAACGNDTDLSRFSFENGGAMCATCRSGGSVRLRVGLMQYLSGLAASDLDALPVEDGTLTSEAMGVTRRFVEFHLERRLSSLAILDQ